MFSEETLTKALHCLIMNSILKLKISNALPLRKTTIKLIAARNMARLMVLPMDSFKIACQCLCFHRLSTCLHQLNYSEGKACKSIVNNRQLTAWFLKKSCFSMMKKLLFVWMKNKCSKWLAERARMLELFLPSLISKLLSEEHFLRLKITKSSFLIWSTKTRHQFTLLLSELNNYYTHMLSPPKQKLRLKFTITISFLERPHSIIPYLFLTHYYNKTFLKYNK